MAKNELVDEFISSKGEEQIEKLKKDIPILVSQVAELSKTARGAFDGFGNSKTLEDLVKQSRAAQQVNSEMVAKVHELGQAYKAADAIMAVHNGTSTKYIQVSKGVADVAIKEAKAHQENAKAAVSEAKASVEASKAKVQEAKATSENARQKEIETRYTILLTKEKERLDAAAAKEQARLNSLQSDYGKLNAEYKEAAKLAQDLGARQYMLQREVNAGNNVQVNNTELARLGPQLAEAQANAMKLHTALLTVDQAVGRSQRNVGNYNQAQFAMSQLLREAPAFAYNFSTGLLALSNNIPILADEITRLKTTNEALKASGEKTIPIWKTLMGAITSPVGLITVATSVITILAARMSTVGEETSKATKLLQNFNSELERLENFESNIFGSNETSRTDYEALIQTITDKTSSIEAQTKAYHDLANIMPAITREYSMEDIANGKGAEAMRKKANAIIELTTNLKENKRIYEEELRSFKKLEQQYLGGDTDPSNHTAEHIKQENDLLAAYLSTKNDLVVRRREILRDQVQLNKLNPPDLPNKKPVKDNTLKNEQDLTKELYDEYAKRLQLSAEYQKAIAEDETKSLEERINAHRQYAELTFQAQSEALSAQYDNVEKSLKDIDRIEKKSAKDRTQQEKELLGKKAVLLQEFNTISAEYDLKEKQHIEKTAKEIVAIQQNEVRKRIDAIKDLMANADSQQEEALHALAESLKAGTITYKQYTAQKQQIEDKFQKEKYRQLVAYLKAEIAALAAQGVNVSALQEQLNAAMKHLYDADLKEFEDNEKKKEERTKAIRQKIYEGISQGLETGQAFVDAYYQRQLDHEQSLLDAIEARKNAEIDAINSSMMSQKKKEEAIRSLNAQTAAQEKAIQNEMRRIKREQAIADRVASILRVVENTAIAITAALAIPGYGQVLAGIDAAIGAAQIAAIMAQPLPIYGKGVGVKPGDPAHPGGPAVIGDKPEFVFEPNKAPYFTDKAHIANLARDTRVIPEADLIAGTMGLMTPGLLNTIQIANDNAQLERATKEGFERIEHAIKSKQEVHFSWNNGELVKSVKHGNNWVTFINQQFNA